MNPTSNDGGPAFPVPEQHGQQILQTANGPEWEQGWEPAHPGMSIRDWFAGQALAGMLADPTVNGTHLQIAKSAYEFSDAMLAARTPKPPSTP